MKHVSIKVVAGLALALAAGCGESTYQANATDTQLSAYAGKSHYPDSIQAEEARHIFANIQTDGTIALFNAGDQTLSNFELWLNKAYVLHVDSLPARSKLAVAPESLYNKDGMNFKGQPVSTIASIQILADGKLWDVQGPIVQH